MVESNQTLHRHCPLELKWSKVTFEGKASLSTSKMKWKLQENFRYLCCPFFSGVIFKTRSGNEAPEELNQAANSH